MRIYVTARYKGSDNKAEIEALCSAVRSSGHEDFCYIRDVEDYQRTFDDPKKLWKRSEEEIAASDALLIDISDNPSGGRVVEAGIAYALNKPIFVVVKAGQEYKDLYNGIATKVIEYKNYDDISRAISTYTKV